METTDTSGVSEQYLEVIEDGLRPNSPTPIASSSEIQRITEQMIIHREYQFYRLSRVIVRPHEVLKELAKLSRIEAVCVALQRRPFEAALKKITLMLMATLGFSFVTCVAVIAYAFTHW